MPDLECSVPKRFHNVKIKGEQGTMRGAQDKTAVSSCCKGCTKVSVYLSSRINQLSDDVGAHSPCFFVALEIVFASIARLASRPDLKKYKTIVTHL